MHKISLLVFYEIYFILKDISNKLQILMKPALISIIIIIIIIIILILDISSVK